MACSSGLSGFCANNKCKHANDVHVEKSCTVAGCTEIWKICGVGPPGHTYTGPGGVQLTSFADAICLKCPNHPLGAPPADETRVDLT